MHKSFFTPPDGFDVPNHLNELSIFMREKAQLSRSTAKTSRKKGNLKKADKFNAIARVYEMINNKLEDPYFPF